MMLGLSIFRSSIIAGVLALGAAAGVGAQQRDTTAAETRQDSTAPPPVRLPAFVVTGTKLAVARDRLGYAVTVVTAADLEAERPFSAADALRDLPGAYIDEAAGPGGPTIVRLRGGEEVFTQILMDGVQINQNGGFFDFQGFPLTNVERIEVARGPQSAVYGSSAVSGVVQFVTRRGAIGPARLEITAEGGGAAEQGGTFHSSATAGGGTQLLQYSAGAGLTYSRGIYQLPHDTWTRDGSVRLDLTPSGPWSVTGLLRYVAVESMLPVRDPGARRVPLDPNARNERDRLISSVIGTFSPSRDWTHEVRASVYREDFLFEDQRDNVPADTFDFFIFDADFALDSDLWRPTLEYVGSYRTRLGDAVSDLAFTFGGQWQREKLTDRTSGEFGDNTLSLERNSGAAFAEIRGEIARRVDVLVGARTEKFKGFAAEVTPRASAVFHVVPEALAFRGAVARAYKAPNLQEQFLDNPFIASNPDLVPETSTSWEVGVDYQSAIADLAIEVTYFRQHFQDLIRTVAQESSSQQINRNLGSSRAQGVEWNVRYRPLSWLMAGIEGAWVTTDILDNTGLNPAEFPEGESLPFRPQHMTSALVVLAPVPRLQVSLRGTWVGTQTVLTERFSGDRVDLKPYLLPGFRMNLAVSPRFTVYTRVENLFDAYYKTAFDRPGIPLTAAAGVRISN
jgi:outer membrane cobalamin receptor